MGRPLDHSSDETEAAIETANQERRLTDRVKDLAKPKDPNDPANAEAVISLLANLQEEQKIIIPTDLNPLNQDPSLPNPPILAKIISLPEAGATKGVIEVEYETSRADRRRTKRGTKPVLNSTQIEVQWFLRLLKDRKIRVPLSRGRAQELANFDPEDVTVEGKKDLSRTSDAGGAAANLREEIRLRFPKLLKDREE
jgi:hypothetical protein